jgi:hypothetical protein
MEMLSLSDLYGELEDARLIVLLTGEGDEFLALLILKLFVVVFVKLIFSTLLVLKRLSWLLG